MANKKKIILGFLIVLLISLYIGVKAYAEKTAKKEVDIAIGKLNDFANVDYEKVSVDLLGLNAHIKGITILSAGQKEKTTIDDIIIFKIDGKEKIPSYLHISINGINIDIDSLGNEAKELGYDNIRSNVELDYKYDSKEKEFYLKKLNYGAEKIGTINLSFYISNIDLNPDNFAFLLFSMPQILIHNAELTYNDDSLMPRLLKKAAKKDGKNVESFINKITNKIENEISKTEDKFTKEALTSFNEFVKNPNKISINIYPKDPVPIGRMQMTDDSEEIIKLLNIKVSI